MAEELLWFSELVHVQFIVIDPRSIIRGLLEDLPAFKFDLQEQDYPVGDKQKYPEYEQRLLWACFKIHSDVVNTRRNQNIESKIVDGCTKTCYPQTNPFR